MLYNGSAERYLTLPVAQSENGSARFGQRIKDLPAYVLFFDQSEIPSRIRVVIRLPCVKSIFPGDFVFIKITQRESFAQVNDSGKIVRLGEGYIRFEIYGRFMKSIDNILFCQVKAVDEIILLLDQLYGIVVRNICEYIFI